MADSTATVHDAEQDVRPAAEDDSTEAGTELNRRLRAQYAEIAQLAGGLAHEIRNPLSTMWLNLDLLAEDFQEPEDPRERRVLQKIERVRRESHRLESLLEDFLRFARVQALRRKPTDLNSLVDELRDFFEPQAAAQGVVFRVHYADDLPRVPLDADLFKQALFNLIRNAAARHARWRRPDPDHATRRPLGRARRDRHRLRHPEGGAEPDFSAVLLDPQERHRPGLANRRYGSSRPTAATSRSRVSRAKGQSSRSDYPWMSNDSTDGDSPS